MAKTILVVENELRNREIIAHFLREENYDVYEAEDGDRAIQMLGDKNFDLMICDVVMPRLNAFEIISHMQSKSLSTSVILITGHPYLVAANGFGHLPAFTKPFNMYDLLHKVREIISE